MSKWLDLLGRLSFQPNELDHNSERPRDSTDKTDKSSFGSFVSWHLGPFQIPRNCLADLQGQFEEPMPSRSVP